MSGKAKPDVSSRREHARMVRKAPPSRNAPALMIHDLATDSAKYVRCRLQAAPWTSRATLMKTRLWLEGPNAAALRLSHPQSWKALEASEAWLHSGDIACFNWSDESVVAALRRSHRMRRLIPPPLLAV